MLAPRCDRPHAAGLTDSDEPVASTLQSRRCCHEPCWLPAGKCPRAPQSTIKNGRQTAPVAHARALCLGDRDRGSCLPWALPVLDRPGVARHSRGVSCPHGKRRACDMSRAPRAAAESAASCTATQRCQQEVCTRLEAPTGNDGRASSTSACGKAFARAVSRCF